MPWANRYTADKQPTAAQISTYISSPLWEELEMFLRQNYQVEPKYSYSVCSGQPGWNVKYQKAGRSLCTLYPMEGFFIALVVIGNREEVETQLLLPALSRYVQTLFADTKFSAGGRWLMIRVTDTEILDDVKQLIQLRRPIRKK